MFWVHKRIVSLRRLLEYPQHVFWMRNKENSFTISTLFWRPGLQPNTFIRREIFKISNIFLLLFSNKILFISAEFYKILDRVSSRKDPDQTTSSVCDI